MNRIRKFFAGLLALIMPLAGGCARANQSDSQTGFEMHVIDVGKADCILIKCDGEYMLVDTGLKDSEDAIRAYLKAQNVAEFNYVVATHPDKDHIGGMPWILSDYKVGQALVCPLEEDSKPYMRMMAALSAEGTNTAYPKAGDEFTLGGASITVMSPTDALVATEDENECSIVMMVQYGEKRFLLMGDAQEMAEEWLIKSDYNLNADVIKVGHHGSDKSTSPIFLNMVKPEYAAISCGYSDKDDYPADGTIETLGSAGVKVLRTDEDGTIVFRSDGQSIEVSTAGK